MVGERSVSLRRCVERHAGDIRSANADVSNDKGGEKHIVTGKQVNIPARLVIAMGGRRRLGGPGDGCPGESA